MKMQKASKFILPHKQKKYDRSGLLLPFHHKQSQLRNEMQIKSCQIMRDFNHWQFSQESSEEFQA